MSNRRLEPRGTETTQRGGSEARMPPRLGGGDHKGNAERAGQAGKVRGGEKAQARAGRVPFKEG